MLCYIKMKKTNTVKFQISPSIFAAALILFTDYYDNTARRHQICLFFILSVFELLCGVTSKVSFPTPLLYECKNLCKLDKVKTKCFTL